MSAFWERKVRTYFAKADTNGDGIISKKEAEDMSERFLNAENASQEQRQKIKREFEEIWGMYMKSAGTDNDGLLTPDIMVASIAQQRTDPRFMAVFIKLAHTFFGVLDANGDGYLSEDEYVRAFNGVDPQALSLVRAAFEYMDVNKDGKVDLAEYSSAFYLYLTTEDEHLMFGPLV